MLRDILQGPGRPATGHYLARGVSSALALGAVLGELGAHWRVGGLEPGLQNPLWESECGVITVNETSGLVVGLSIFRLGCDGEFPGQLDWAPGGPDDC